jgi:hypothetical protein
VPVPHKQVDVVARAAATWRAAHELHVPATITTTTRCHAVAGRTRCCTVEAAAAISSATVSTVADAAARRLAF